MKFKLKTEKNYFTRPFTKTQLEVVVWRHFLNVARPICHSFFTMANLQLDKYPWLENFSNYNNLELKKLHIRRTIRKFKFQATV